MTDGTTADIVSERMQNPSLKNIYLNRPVGRENGAAHGRRSESNITKIDDYFGIQSAILCVQEH